MKRLLLSIIFLVLIIFSPFVLGQNDIKIPGEPSPYASLSQPGLGPDDILFFSLSFISLLIGILITVFMVKKSPKILNTIIQGLVAIITAIIIILLIIIPLIKFGSTFWMSWFIVPIFLLSVYFTINLMRKKRFEEEKRYGINLSSGMIIITMLIVISSIIAVNIPSSLVSKGWAELAILLIMVYGIILSFILGIVGIIVDKIRKK